MYQHKKNNQFYYSKQNVLKTLNQKKKLQQSNNNLSLQLSMSGQVEYYGERENKINVE